MFQRENAKSKFYERLELDILQLSRAGAVKCFSSSHTNSRLETYHTRKNIKNPATKTVSDSLTLNYLQTRVTRANNMEHYTKYKT